MHKILYRAIIIAATLPAFLQAAEWSAEPKISLRMGYNDNIRLTPADHDSVREYVLAPSVKFGVATENQGLFGDAGFTIRKFTGGSGQESSATLDREDYRLNMDAYHNTLRDSLKANVNYVQDSTLDSELDAGIISDQRATRERITLGPSWSSSLNEQTRLNMSYQFTKSDYTDDPGIADLVNYKYHSLSTSLLYQLTSHLQATLFAGYNSYKPDTGFNSDTLSLQAGFSRNFSETLVASFLVGQRMTTSDSLFGSGFCIGANPGATFPACTGGIAIPTGGIKGEVDNTAVVFSASFEKTLETGSLSANLSRSSAPGNNGELLDTTRLLLSGDHQLSERLGTSLRVEYTENETIVNRVGFAPNQGKDKIFRVTPKISWNWQQDWKVEGEYHYVISDRIHTTEATRNAFYVNLTYRLPKRSLSR